MASSVHVKDLWNEQRIFTHRTLAAIILIGLLSAALFARLVWLQVVQHGYYLELSQGNRVRLEPIPASRGLILDRHGKVLADNEPGYQLELVREQTPDLLATLQRLAALDLIAKEDIEDTRRIVLSRRSFDSVPIRLRMSDEEIGRFAVHRHEFQGVDLRTRQTRHYPFGDLAVHALGYVGALSEQDLERVDRTSYAGTNLIGKVGVESRYEKELHGRNGYREVLVNAQGRSVQRVGAYAPQLKSLPPTPGRDLVLTLDLAAQQAAETGMGNWRGAVVAIDPRNGDVLALVSRPGFDPGLFARGLTRGEYAQLTESIDKPLLDRALRGAYPPGSTIKPFIALAGLNYKVIDPDNHEYCHGFYTLPGSAHHYRDWKPHGHGSVNLYDAIAQSCDVYFYGLARQLGPERIAAFLGQFGFGQDSGIDIAGEKPGTLPSPAWKKQTFKRPGEQVWFPGETVIFGIGQGFLTVTPLELAHATALVAARGKNYAPRLLMALRDPLDTHTESLSPKLLPGPQDVPPEAFSTVVRGMVEVTTRGTGRAAAAGAAYAIAGKTGTAQVFSLGQNEKYNEKLISERNRDHAWFIAFAPADDPKIAVAVLVENGSHGATAAAPIARKVMDAYLLGKGEPARPPAPKRGAETPAPGGPAPGTTG